MKLHLASWLAVIGLTGTLGIWDANRTPVKADIQNGEARTNQFWWPNQLNLQPLRQQSPNSNPMDRNFNYGQAFEKLDLAAVKNDIKALMTASQDWWPADWGNYGPLFIRMAWHAAGTYRTADGRGGAAGGQLRFEPLNSWPDNTNLDKARRLLWPVKKKYGKSLSWADLMVLTGNVPMESMGFKTLGFAGGRTDDWEPDLVYWGPEKAFLASERHDVGANKKRNLKGPLAAARMGLIYVNPEGPNGNGDPIAAAYEIRQTFGRMAMNDEETVALIAGGHTFGKSHGAHKGECLAAEPAAAPLEQQGLGWKNKCVTGKGKDTVTSGLEGAWTQAPTQWSMLYLTNLFAYEWKQVKSPAGAIQWVPKAKGTDKMVADAHVKGKRNPIVMLTTDLSLKMDPSYKKISERFLKNPQEFERAFAQAWFKLTHRDMGPRARYLGSDIPKETFAWQDPIPTLNHDLVDEGDIKDLKEEILDTGLTVPELVRVAWASASSFRATDMRGGANGARIRLEPQINWTVNNPTELKKVLAALENVQKEWNQSNKRTPISMADLIVLGGAAAIEKAALDGGFKIEVPFKPGRMDAGQKETDVASFAALEPHADAFRNYFNPKAAYNSSPTFMLVEKAALLGLTVPEMTVLIGGMRSLGANAMGIKHGIFTDKPGTLSTDYFVSLMDMSVEWRKSKKDPGIYEAYDRKTNKLRWTATPVDLVFGSNAELRTIAEVYGADDGKEKFMRDFVNTWSKIMVNDRFELGAKQFTYAKR